MIIDLFGLAIPLVYVHVGTLFLIIPVILFADEQGLAWMLGKKETLHPRIMRVTHNLVWAGLIIMIGTGAIMAWPLREFLSGTPAFWTKMFFVLVLVVNSFFIGKFAHIAMERPFRELSREERTPLFISGIASAVGWLGAVVSAVLMGLAGPLTQILNSVL